jgi:hypothetical protein
MNCARRFLVLPGGVPLLSDPAEVVVAIIALGFDLSELLTGRESVWIYREGNPILSGEIFEEEDDLSFSICW